MGKFGAFVTDPGAGAYCKVTLDSGDRLLVNHPKGGFKGGVLTVTEVRWWGMAAGETLLTCDLDNPQGKAAAASLVPPSVPPDSAWATPLGAVVAHLSQCRTLAEARDKCVALARASA